MRDYKSTLEQLAAMQEQLLEDFHSECERYDFDPKHLEHICQMHWFRLQKENGRHLRTGLRDLDFYTTQFIEAFLYIIETVRNKSAN